MARGGAERDGYTVRTSHHQLFRRPWIASAEARRDELGGRWIGNVTHPFYTDLQRIAWRVSGGHEHEFTYLRQPAADELVLGARRDFADIGGIVRVGPPGRLSLFGVSLSHERARVDTTLRRFTELGYVAVPDTMAVLARYRDAHSLLTRCGAFAPWLPGRRRLLRADACGVKEGFGRRVVGAAACSGTPTRRVVAADLYGG